MFKLNLKIALRNLWKNKGYTLINVGGLAIGLVSCMLLLLYVAYEWSFDKQGKNSKELYVVYHNYKAENQHFSWAWTPGKMANEVRDKITGVSNASHSTYPQDVLIAHEEQRFQKKMIYTEPSFVKMLDFKFIKGNPNKVLQNVNSVVLTETMAKNLFGDTDPINQSVKLDNKEVLTVEAVIEDIPLNSSIRFDYLVPWALYEKQNPWTKEAGWGSNFCLTLVQLQNNSFFAKANAEMEKIYQRNDADFGDAMLHPLTKWHLYDKFENGKSVGGKIDQIKLFFVLAFCILLIACVNFMNLSTARSEKRSKEVGVRKAIGSSRRSLISQFMLESVLLAIFGMAVAFILIEVSLPYFNGLLNIQLAINYGDWRFWSVLLGLTLLTGLIAGSYPAFYLSSFNPVKVLKGFNVAKGATLSIRKVLVVFQFTFAACLIVCTAVIYQQLNYIKNKPIGFERNGMVEIPIQGNLRNKLTVLKSELVKSGAVSHVTFFSTSVNEGGNNTFSISWPGKGAKEQILFNNRAVGLDFAATLGTKMVAGQEFSQSSDSTKVIVNEAAIKVMNMKDPVGKQIFWGKSKMTIIGVMKDFVMESPYQSTNPMIAYYNMGDVNRVVLRLNPTENLSAAITRIEQIVKALNPEYPVGTYFVNDGFEDKFQNERLLGTLSNWFGGFAIFISCLGLLGLALFIAEQRKKEISIRKVLGASTVNILTLLNKDFIKLVAISNLIAFPLAYIIVKRWLSSYEFRVEISVLPFLIAGILSLIIAILTVSVQSMKVAKANPIDALKYE